MFACPRWLLPLSLLLCVAACKGADPIQEVCELVLTCPCSAQPYATADDCVAGLKQQSELFRDNWGHAQLPLQLLSSYCHFAVIYRKSPVGLPLPLAFRTLKDMSDDDKTKLNTLLQQIAWDTVSAHPMSGIMK